MLRQTWTHGRRGALVAASAAVVCLGVTLGACGDGGRDGYVAVGAVPGPGRTAGAPTGGVRMVPLDGPSGAAGSTGSANSAGDAGTSQPPSQQAPSTAEGTAPDRTADGTGAAGAAPDPAETPSGTTPPPSPTPTPSHAKPPEPAKLAWGDPEGEATDQRWCEKVTVAFHNSGGSAVRSGTVTFGTHIIGLLGIDWGTVDSTEDLPVPIAAGAREKHTWTVCVDAWRVPLGMHIETRDVSVRWE
ncbi:hypothetical protein [Streptomyces sp. NPDC002520]